MRQSGQSRSVDDNVEFCGICKVLTFTLTPPHRQDSPTGRGVSTRRRTAASFWTSAATGRTGGESSTVTHPPIPAVDRAVLKATSRSEVRRRRVSDDKVLYVCLCICVCLCMHDCMCVCVRQVDVCLCVTVCVSVCGRSVCVCV